MNPISELATQVDEWEQAIAFAQSADHIAVIVVKSALATIVAERTGPLMTMLSTFDRVVFTNTLDRAHAAFVRHLGN